MRCAGLAPLVLARTALAAAPPLVEVDGGAVVGIRSGELASDRGIPFASSTFGQDMRSRVLPNKPQLYFLVGRD